MPPLLTRFRIRSQVRTSPPEQMHDLRAGIIGYLGDEMMIGFALVQEDFSEYVTKKRLMGWKERVKRIAAHVDSHLPYL
jgi:nitrogen fixation/metabolism regulation signal transduction histidine kinase